LDVRWCESTGSKITSKDDPALPDNAVRIAVASLDKSGQVSFGPVQIGTSGNSYQVVLDYINVDTANIYFDIWYSGRDQQVRSLYSTDRLPPDAKVTVVRFNPGEAQSAHKPKGDVVVIPVYVGFGVATDSYR
jgi:hypothetical protein